MRILRRLFCDFLIGVVMFFAPFVALILLLLIITPFLLSILAGCWAVLCGAAWLFLHDQFLRQPAIDCGIASVVLFGIGWMMLGMLVDLAFRLWRPRRPAEPSLEMSLMDEGKAIH
jgi:hypothetical protein